MYKQAADKHCALMERKMVPQLRELDALWVVVIVESGIPVIVEAYRNIQHAKIREKFWRKHMHPENDETGVFEVGICHAT